MEATKLLGVIQGLLLIGILRDTNLNPPFFSKSNQLASHCSMRYHTLGSATPSNSRVPGIDER